MLVGRPYNIFDRSVNCDIPRKLRTLYGVNVLPMEVLPLDEEDISEVNPNMYWNSGRRILAAARIEPAQPQPAPGLHFQLQVRSRLLHQIVRRRSRRQALAGACSSTATPTTPASSRAAKRISTAKDSCDVTLLRPTATVSRKIGPDHPLSGKVVYIPTMGEGSPEAFAAAFRWLGVKAQPTPPSDERTRELGGKYTSGDECYPAKVTVGDFLRVIEQPGFDAERTAFFMPTAEGPCRFGQYAPFLRKILRDAG